MKKTLATLTLAIGVTATASAATLTFNGLRPANQGSWSVDGGAAIANTGNTFTGYAANEGFTGGLETGTLTLLGEDINIDGTLYDLQLEIVLNGNNTEYQDGNDRFRQSFDGSTGNVSTLSYATPTLTIFNADTVVDAGLDIIFDGFTLLNFSSFGGDSNNISGTGISTISGNTSTSVDVTGATDITIAAASGGTYNLTGISGQFTVVPEPSSYALLAGLLGLGYVMVRRRS